VSASASFLKNNRIEKKKKKIGGKKVEALVRKVGTVGIAAWFSFNSKGFQTKGIKGAY
jgi:hypothetical protein